MSKDISPPRKLVERKVPSGMNSAWKLWRHCICRNGFYPLLIAPVVTATFLLDVYVSSGCNLMHVEIGIEPTNVAWSKSTLDLGLFSHLSDETNSGSNLLMDTFHPTCKGFDSNFDKYFIDGDKTWKMTQIIALVAGCAGCVATVTIWMMVITPLPSCFFWPGVLLPAVLIELLAGSARFLLFDSQVCHQDLWVPTGEAAVGQKAESCTLSSDSWVAIGTSILSLVNVLLICLRAPKRRKLNDEYGMQYKDVNHDMANLRTDTMEDSMCNSQYKDVESQKQRIWSPKEMSQTPSWDLEEIVQQQMLQGNNVSKPKQTMQSKKSSSSRNRRQAKNRETPTHKTVLPTVEDLRSVEPSFENTSKEFQDIMDSGKKQKKAINSENAAINFHSETKLPKEQQFEENQPTKTKTAPSDEGGFGFRSPLKAFKDNFSPRVLSTKSKWKKQDTWASPSPKAYDEKIIFNCLDNLEKQFSESDYPPQTKS